LIKEGIQPTKDQIINLLEWKPNPRADIHGIETSSSIHSSDLFGDDSDSDSDIAESISNTIEDNETVDLNINTNDEINTTIDDTTENGKFDLLNNLIVNDCLHRTNCIGKSYSINHTNTTVIRRGYGQSVCNKSSYTTNPECPKAYIIK